VLGGACEWTYSDAKARRAPPRPAFEQESTAAGRLTDKYWLTALTPADQGTRIRAAYRHVPEGQDRWQVDCAAGAQTVAPGRSGASHPALRRREGGEPARRLRRALGILDFDKAVDFGWFYFLTKPVLPRAALPGRRFGNFGVAILVFTLLLKALFFPLANKAYKSMAR
jgi:YidC/Oxa1 family membrane protein insertase